MTDPSTKLTPEFQRGWDAALLPRAIGMSCSEEGVDFRRRRNRIGFPRIWSGKQRSIRDQPN